MLAASLFTGLPVILAEYVGFIAWISMIPLVIALSGMAEQSDLRLRRIYAYGLFYFEIYYAVCFHWFVYIHPLDFTGLDNFSSLLVVITAWLGLPFLQSLFSAFCFVLAVAVMRSRLAARLPWIKLLSLPAAYTFFEYFQT